MSDTARSRLKPTLVCLTLLVLASTAVGAAIRHRSRLRASRMAPVIPATPLTAEVPKAGTPLAPDPAWGLKGGLFSGRFLGQEARGQWPPWMQALLGDKAGQTAEALQEADLYKVPDVFLPKAMELLTARRVFTPRLLKQATAIGYTAQASEWDKARTAYQIAYLRAQGLPVQDPLTASRLLTHLLHKREFALVKELLQRSRYPAADPTIHAAFLRMTELEQGKVRASDNLVLDPGRPAFERLHGLMFLKRPGDPASLLASFQNTDCLDLAVFYALSRKWIASSDPAVDAALSLRKKPCEASAWMLVRPEERVSDLLWMRAMEALERGDRTLALAHAGTLLEQYPDSWFAGHAAYLLAALDPAFHAPATVSLRVPGDLTWYNVERLEATMPRAEPLWPEPYQADAAKGRYDLILAKADPAKETDSFLRAAHLAGQQDLVARYLACERGCTPVNAAYLYPIHLAALAQRLLREEGLEGQVDVAFVLAMIKNESVFQPTARSGANAFGIMQLLRPTFRHMARRGADILDPEANIRAGIRYYRSVIDTAHLRDLPMETRLCYVLAGYHAGEGRARRWREASESALGGQATPLAMLRRVDAVPITSTRQYITRAMGDREIFRQLLEGRKG